MVNPCLTLLSARYSENPGQKRIYALVPGNADEARDMVLSDIHDVWKRERIYCHWTITVRTDQARVRPRSVANFWLADSAEVE